MPAYVVTDKAPSRIADKPHNGPGSVVMLTESQAKYELIHGHIVLHEVHEQSMTAGPETKKAKG